ncbi:tail fiber assembly protein [Pseudomonas sp. ICMP 8385]|uniref:tail fiber assembly protein n=1 Tax=Pseudomonas sp. ICMP 8385 TaxID=1718920 RepID=UPI00211D5CA4|nr:tail fiber assembly protein [Pseudomonas sp. ICMP 8385]
MMTTKKEAIVESSNVTIARDLEGAAAMTTIENIQRVSDGSYMVTYNGVPHHVVKLESPELYAQVLAGIEGGAKVEKYLGSSVPDELKALIPEPAIENIQSRSDGSYVVSYKGLPFHATKLETPEVYEQVLANIEAGEPVAEYQERIIPPPSPTEEAQGEIVRLRAIVDYAIAPLQDAVDIDVASDTDVVALKAWKKYRVALSRVHEQQGYPLKIEWPAVPIIAPNSAS